MRVCEICRAGESQENISLFCVPMHEGRRRRWVESCGIDFKESSRVCNNHFDPIDFINGPPGNKKCRLMPGAVPKRCLNIVRKQCWNISKSTQDKVLGKQIKQLDSVENAALFGSGPQDPLASVGSERISSSLETYFSRTMADEDITTEIKTLMENKIIDPFKEEPTIFSAAFDESVKSILPEDGDKKTISIDESEIPIEDFQNDEHETRKCGHITYDIDEDIFTLNCFFCSTICLDLLTFSDHVKMQHYNLCKEKIQFDTDAYTSDINNTTAGTHGSGDISYIITETNKVKEYSNTNPRLNVAFDKHEEITNFGIDTNNRSLMLYLLHLIKSAPIIFWIEKLQLKKREVALMYVTNALNKKFPYLKFTFENVSAFICSIKATYESELKAIRAGGKHYQPKLWFFNRLKFLEYNDGISDQQDTISQHKESRTIETTDEALTSKVTISSETVVNDAQKIPNFDPELNILTEKSDESSMNVSDDENYTMEVDNVNCTLESGEGLEMENLEIDINNRPLVSYFMQLLNRKPFIFWNKELEFKKRKAALEGISNTLAKKFPQLQITYNSISTMIFAMRAAYRSELKQEQITKERGIDYVPQLWFFNKLKSFESDYKTLEPQKKIKCLLVIAMQLPLNIFRNCTDNEVMILDVIKHYEKQPHLWNINHPNFDEKYNENGVPEFFKFVCTKYQDELRKRYTLGMFKKALENLHRWYSAEDNIRLYMEDLNQPYKSYYPRVYEALEFLRGHAPPYCCNHCDSTFKTDKNFIFHKKRCTDDIIKECDLCHTTFCGLSLLNAHIRRVHNKGSFPCTICFKICSTRTALRHHTIRRHKETKFKCNECERSYHSPADLRKHINAHLGIKNFICDVCGKDFTTSKALFNHRSNHFADTKRTGCSYCGKSFLAKYSKMHNENCKNRQERKKKGKTKLLNLKSAGNELRKRKSNVLIPVEEIFELT